MTLSRYLINIDLEARPTVYYLMGVECFEEADDLRQGK